MVGFLLFVVAVGLTAAVFALSVLFTPIYFLVIGKWNGGRKRLAVWFTKMAKSIDQFGNGSCGHFLNATLIKRSARKRAYLFGNIDETASFVIGMNGSDRRDALNKVGNFVKFTLDIVENLPSLIRWVLGRGRYFKNSHTEKAIRIQKESDEKASERLLNNFY